MAEGFYSFPVYIRKPGLSRLSLIISYEFITLKLNSRPAFTMRKKRLEIVFFPLLLALNLLSISSRIQFIFFAYSIIFRLFHNLSDQN